MKTHYAVALAMFAGVGIGAVAVHGLHAQAKPPVYYISEIETTNPDAYVKNYVPQAQAVIKAHGGRILAAGQGTAVEGEPPKWRVVVQVWDSMDQIQAWRNSAEFKKVREIGNTYAKFRAFTVEGASQ